MVFMEFEKAKQILNKYKKYKYTDEEVTEILKLLNVFVEVTIKNLLQEKADEKRNSVR
jgi:hypothetical protein